MRGLSKAAVTLVVVTAVLIVVVAGEAYLLLQKTAVTRTVTETKVETVTVTKSAPAATVTKSVTTYVTSVTTVTITAAAASPPKPSAKYVVVTDARGKEVKVPVPVRRVVSLYGLAPPFLYLLGAGDRFYGGWSFGTPFYELVDPNFSRKVALGKSLSVEEIVKVHPQLVLATTWGRMKREVNQLESLGIPVLCIRVESIDDIYSTLKALGKALQAEERANEVIKYYNSVLSKVESRVSKATERPKVLVLYYSGKHHSLMTFGGDMFQSKLIELAGGVSVTKDLIGKKSVNVEQVIKWDPDYIVIIQYRVSAEKVIKIIESDPAWKVVKAVKEGRVYVVPYDGENWIDPCPKWALGLLWLAKVLHPDLFKDVNVTEVAAQFYKEFFNLDISKVRISGDLSVAEARSGG